MNAPARLGILGGTFDPIHIGHLVMASFAITELQLDQVWFMPAATPPHKEKVVSPVEARLEMTRLAIDDDSRFRVSELDIRDDVSFTSELLTKLHDLYPDTTLVFLIGADSLNAFPTWHEPQTILAHADLGVADRVGSEIDEQTLGALPNLRSSVHRFESPLIELSSTLIRERRQERLPITYLVPESVERYILERGLYTKDDSRD